MFYKEILVFYKSKYQDMHIGRNVSRLRGYRGMKQGDMAKQLKMTQQNYSLIENSEHISDTVLKKIADVLDYDVEFIKQMPDAPYVYSNNQQGGNVVNYEFNPVDKIIQLYENLLAEERKKNANLESLLKKKGA